MVMDGIRDGDAAGPALEDYSCPGCGDEIRVGEHHLIVKVELTTRMPPDWRPVREVSPTVLDARLHNPACALLWLGKDPIIQDVYGR